MRALNLDSYDAVLVSGRALRGIYREEAWTRQPQIWHEAADTRTFRPDSGSFKDCDLVWIGNWAGGARAVELVQFLIEPVRQLKLRARVYGVGFPGHVLRAFERAGIEHLGWLPNYQAPLAYSRARLTVHIPRRRMLPGIPSIRMYEALACGTPLISAPWHDLEGLFAAEHDYLVARNTAEMCRLMERVLSGAVFSSRLARNGRHTIANRHNCALPGIITAGSICCSRVSCAEPPHHHHRTDGWRSR